MYAEIVTLSGVTTLRNYKLARKSVRKHSRLDNKLARTLLGNDKEGLFYGHCQLQGMYYAAREAGKLDEFRRIKKDISRNVIPNF